MADLDLIGLPTASTIASRYNTCATSFTWLNQLCIKPDYNYAEQVAPSAVQDEFGRFRVWAGNIGAHRTGRVSLDYRLREASHMYQRVTELLDELNTTLKEVIAIVSGERKPYDDEFSDSDSSASASSDEDSESGTIKNEGEDPPKSITELQQRALDVNDIVSCLYKLSVAIRNPAPSDRLAKSALIDTSHFVSWDVRHVTEKYPGAEPSLVNRLGEANAKRRQLLKYMEKHHGKLARKVDVLPKIEEPTKDENDIPTDVPKVLQPHGGKVEDTQSQPATVRTAPSALATTVNTQTTVVTFLEVEDDMAMEDTQSETSSATSASTNDDGALRVPPPPKGAMENEPFECPYCFDMMTIRSMISWRKHIFRDLQPYMCTFTDCTRPNRMFGSRHAWRNHEIQTHRREWLCNACQHNFSSKTDLESHMRATHAGSFADHQLSALIDMCERPIANTALEKCPLCLQENQPLKSHLARHLQTLALFTLPRRDSESDDDMASIGAHVWHSDDEEDDQRMEGMGDVESGSEISSAGMREIPDVVDEEANRGLARDEISQRLLSKVTPGTNSQQAALDVEKWTEEEKRAFMLSWGVNPSVDPKVAVALVQSWEETTRKKEEEEEEEEEGSRAKKPVPEIDFTLHTMDDGTLVSAAPEDAQTAICKELIGIITKDSGFWTLEQKKGNAALDIESWSNAQKVQFQSTFGVDPVASPETAVALVLGWEKSSRRKAKEKKATDEGGEKNEQAAEETSKDAESSKDKTDVDGESEKAKQERARDEFFKRLGSKIRQQQPREGREGTYLLQVESLSEEEIKQFELFSGFDPRHDPKVAFELAQIYEEDALRRGKVEKDELALGREEEKTENAQGQPSLGATFADDPTSLWSLSPVLEWLEENGFSELWRETFKDLGLQSAGFLGFSDMGNTHSVVLPQLAKVCARRGVEWNETKEQEEANRMRDLIGRFKRGGQERELKDRFFQLRRAEDVVDGDFEEKKADSAEVETRKKSLDEVMSRVRRDVEKAGLPPWLFRNWEMERLKEDYMILQGMDAQVDMDFNEREKAFQFRMTRLKNSMRVAALPLILLAEWDKELGKPEEVEPLGVESAMKRFKDDYRKLAALEEREKQIEKRTGEGKIEYDLRVLIRSMSNSGLPLSLLKEWTRELGTPHSLSKIVDLEIERIEGMEIVERERAEERKGYELFVGNLFPDVDEFLLMSTFDSRYSSCMSASVRKDPNARQNYGADRNCGVVRFSSESDKQRALYEMQDAYCGSTPMRLSTYPPECWLDDSPDAPDRSHRLNLSAPADMEGAVPNSKDPARQFLSVPGRPITPTMEPEMDKRAASSPAGPDPQFPPPSSQATGNTQGTNSYDGRQGANSYEAMKSTLSTSTSSIPGVEDIPSFSPFPKLVNTSTNIPPSDEEKEILLEKARIPVLHSDDPEMQLAWAQDALTWVEIAQNDGNRISKRPSTPQIEHCIRKDAIAIVTFLAEQSHPKAMFMKGIWHEFGKFGYRVDKKEAFLHMRTAAEKGYSRAYYRMGMAYEQSNDAPKAIEMYWRGVSFDDSAACYRMGMMLILGQQGITQDYEEGMKLLYKAAETADENAPQGAYVLGMLQIKELPQVQVPEMYLRVSTNIGKSYIEKAAFLGFSKAQARMGQAYELAQLDCEFDPTTSLHYYVLAARQGEPEAEMSVSKWFLCGYEGIFDKSPELAFEYAQRAAGAEYALAEFALGYFYEVGVYVSIDMQNARLWYEKAAAKGNQDAIARLDSIRRAPEFADLERQNSSLSLAQESSVYQSVYQPRLQMPMPGKIPNITRAELPANRAYREAPDVNPASLSSIQPQPPPQFSSQSQNRQNSFSLAQESSVYQSIYEPRLQMPMPGKIPNITRAELPANQVYREAPDVNPASLSSFQPQPPQFSSQSQKRHQGANTHFGGGESAGSPQSRTGALEASTRTGIGMGPPKPGDSNKDTPTAKKKEKERGFGRLRKFISRGKSPPPVA